MSDELPPDDGTPDDESAFDEHNDAAAGAAEALRQAMEPVLKAQAEIVRQAVEPLTAAFTSQFAEITRASFVVSSVQDVLRSSLRPPQFDFLAQYDFGALKSLQEALARSLPRIDFAQLRQAIRRGTPPNWRLAERRWRRYPGSVLPPGDTRPHQRSNAARSAPSSRPSVVASTWPCGGPTQARYSRDRSPAYAQP